MRFHIPFYAQTPILDRPERDAPLREKSTSADALKKRVIHSVRGITNSGGIELPFLLSVVFFAPFPRSTTVRRLETDSPHPLHQ